MDKSKLPKPPDIEVQQTPDLALATTINKLTQIKENDVIELLGNIKDNEDVMRLAILIHMGKDETLKLEWLKDYAYTELALTNSLRTERGGIRSEHLVRITKNPDIAMNQENGIIDRIKGRFRR